MKLDCVVVETSRIANITVYFHYAHPDFLRLAPGVNTIQVLIGEHGERGNGQNLVLYDLPLVFIHKFRVRR
ncbi:hypothetical protein ARNL5_03039 [Anaerolineae bacterium]|nr:hypothetical protein ARNL5_03039 [Anaerolineae bacterium]